jgi:PAS domain S-box-containing protein
MESQHPSAPDYGILQNSFDGIVVINDEGRIVEFNPAAEKLFGWRRDQVEGRELGELLIPKRLRAAHGLGVSGLAHAANAYAGRRMKAVAVRADGTEFDVEVSVAAVPGAPGGLYIGYIRDISDHVRAEVLLEEQTQLVRTIATYGAEPLFLLDGEGRIAYANPAAERALGWSAHELAGKKLHELTGCACDRTLLCPKLPESVLAGGPSHRIQPHFDACMTRKDGVRLEVVCTISSIVKDGAVVGGVLMVRDVTEQRLAARQLQDLARRLEAYMANSPLAAVEFTPEGAITRWSPAAERIFGWTAGEMIGRRLESCPWLGLEAPPAGDPRPGGRFDAIECFAKNGAQIEIEWHYSSLSEAGGPRLSVLALGVDVTSRNAAVHALKESERRFRATMQRAPVGIAHIDANCRYRLVNDTLCQTLGYRAEELVGRSVREITHPDDVGADTGNIEALIAGRINSYSHEKRYIRKDGSAVWVMVRSSIVCEAPDWPSYVVAVISDISARKRADEALRHSRDQYRFLADSLPQMVFTARPDGVVDYQNRRWREYAGASPVGSVADAWEVLLHPEDRAAAIRQWENCLRGGSPYQVEARIRRADGAHRWHLVRANAMAGENGAVIQWVGTCTDIEEQKRAEAELERKIRERTAEAAAQAQRAEQASQAKSDFLAMMTHEIRSPLNVIVGLAELLGESELPPSQLEYTRVLRKASETLLTVVNDILDISAVEARKLKIERVGFELGAVLESVLAIKLQRAKGRGLSLTCEAAPDIPTRLVGDPNRLRQILINLVGNAMKFTAEGSVRLCVRAAEDAPGDLIFSVADTGIGIPAEKLGLIFEPFTQADSSTTRKYGGTGLGLSISQRLVELMGGRIWVESEPGRGSTFQFRIPFGVQTGEQAEAVRDGPARVLIVDDSYANRLILRQSLAQHVASVVEAANGVEGLARLREAEAAGRPITLALVDSRMPVMGGADFVNEARQAGFSSLAIAIVSSEGGEEERAYYRGVGISAYLTKPLRKSEILSLPQLAPAVGPEAPPASKPPSAGVERSLLLADDSEDNVFLMQAFLRGSGRRLDVASDGAEAVAKFRSGRYDLVLMDVNMPVMDGHAATRAIRAWEAENRRQRTPILALTAHALQSEVDKSVAAGCDAHLSKPIQREALLAAIAAHEGGRPAKRIVATAPAGLEELSRRYLAKRKDGMAALRHLVEAGDCDRVRGCAHDIKGSGASYGFPPLTEMARQLEQAAIGRDLALMSAALQTMEGYLAAVEIGPPAQG